jgi:hypothetical protein
MKTAFAIIALLTLGACAEGQGSYSPPAGDASYDALKSASEQCKARGGQFQLKNGGDNRDLSDYECKIAKGN